MKHSDLKVGMKVKRKAEHVVPVNETNSLVGNSGAIVTVKKTLNFESLFSIEEDNLGRVWEADYFEPVEEPKKGEGN